jgi:hypothetical protein
MSLVRNQAAPSSRVSSAQDDPDNCFNKLQLRNHRDTDLYWFCDDDPASLSKNSGIITEWLLLLLVELDIPTPPGVKWTGQFHDFRGPLEPARPHRGVRLMASSLPASLFHRFSSAPDLSLVFPLL